MPSIYSSILLWFTASTHVLPGNWFPQTAPCAHHSVGAVMIRLWIISLDHYFPLLCWLGAIHLPPPLESQMLLNCLSCTLSLLSLLPPTFPDPVTPHDRHLQSSIYQRPSWAAANASPVCLRTVPKRGNTSPHSAVLMRWTLSQQTVKWQINHVIFDQSQKIRVMHLRVMHFHQPKAWQ